MISSRRGRALHRLAAEVDRRGVAGRARRLRRLERRLDDPARRRRRRCARCGRSTPSRACPSRSSSTARRARAGPASASAPRTRLREGFARFARPAAAARRQGLVRGHVPGRGGRGRAGRGPARRRRLVRVRAADAARRSTTRSRPAAAVVIDDYGHWSARARDRRVPCRRGHRPRRSSAIDYSGPLLAQALTPERTRAARVLVWTETHVARRLRPLPGRPAGRGSTASAWPSRWPATRTPDFDAWLAERAPGLPATDVARRQPAGLAAERCGARLGAAATETGAARQPAGALTVRRGLAAPARRASRRCATRHAATNLAAPAPAAAPRPPRRPVHQQRRLPGRRELPRRRPGRAGRGRPARRALRPQHGLPADLAGRASSGATTPASTRATDAWVTAAHRASDALAAIARVRA